MIQSFSSVYALWILLYFCSCSILCICFLLLIQYISSIGGLCAVSISLFLHLWGCSLFYCYCKLKSLLVYMCFPVQPLWVFFSMSHSVSTLVLFNLAFQSVADRSFLIESKSALSYCFMVFLYRFNLDLQIIWNCITQWSLLPRGLWYSI